MILHCVFCSFRGDIHQTERQAVLTDLAGFTLGLEGVLGFDHGPNADFEGKSPKFTDGFVIRFADRRALAAYADHPTHKALGAKLCDLCEGGADGIMVVDLVCDDAQSGRGPALQVLPDPTSRADQIAQLFKDSFTDSEGAEEGAVIHDLARDLLTTTPKDDLRVFVAEADGTLRGCVISTRLRFAKDPRTAFLLSPMAVATTSQGQGIGQALIRHALEVLQAEGVDVAVTYGDPRFYGRVGFEPVTTDTVPAPLPLNMPEGWIAQSLTDAPLTPLVGPSLCAPALDRPDIW